MEKKVYKIVKGTEDARYFSNLKKAYAYYKDRTPKDRTISYSRIADLLSERGEYHSWTTAITISKLIVE